MITRSLLVFVGLLAASAASGHICGNQDTDNRPNHCEVKKDEVWVHQMSSCKVLEPGRCQYTHCAGSSKVIEDPQCCCLESQQCPSATYVGVCVGSGPTLTAAPAPESASAEVAASPAPTPSNGEQVPQGPVGGVKMRCEVVEGGHRVRVTYTNSGELKNCESHCHHKNEAGNPGELNCKGSIQASVTTTKVFCDSFDDSHTFTIADSGSFSCK